MSVSTRDEVAGGLTTFLTMARTVISMPLTVSITQGISWGFVSHAVLYALAGRGREVGPVMGGRALVSVGLRLVESLAGRDLAGTS